METKIQFTGYVIRDTCVVTVKWSFAARAKVGSVKVIILVGTGFVVLTFELLRMLEALTASVLARKKYAL